MAVLALVVEVHISLSESFGLAKSEELSRHRITKYESVSWIVFRKKSGRN